MNITEARNYITNIQRKDFMENWDNELDAFMDDLPDTYLDKIVKLENPTAILKQIEAWHTEREEKCDAQFYWISVNLALQKKNDRDEMLLDILNTAREIQQEI